MSSRANENPGKVFKKGREITKFITERFSRDNLIEMLTFRSIEEINLFLMEMLLQIGGRRDTDWIEVDHLYVVYRENFEPEGFLCLIGEEIIDPEASIPSRRELHTSLKWHANNHTFESKFTSTQEEWVRHHIRSALDQIYTFALLLSLPILTLQEVLYEEGEGLRDGLLFHHYELLEKAKKEEEFLRDNLAPRFMIKECHDSIARLRRIVQKLNESAKQ